VGEEENIFTVGEEENIFTVGEEENTFTVWGAIECHCGGGREYLSL
jgi:hypothetical protein